MLIIRICPIVSGPFSETEPLSRGEEAKQCHGDGDHRRQKCEYGNKAATRMKLGGDNTEAAK
jgi:hypothetical protein